MLATAGSRRLGAPRIARAIVIACAGSCSTIASAHSNPTFSMTRRASSLDKAFSKDPKAAQAVRCSASNSSSVWSRVRANAFSPRDRGSSSQSEKRGGSSWGDSVWSAACSTAGGRSGGSVRSTTPTAPKSRRAIAPRTTLPKRMARCFRWAGERRSTIASGAVTPCSAARIKAQDPNQTA
ncbi:hypothetical protein D3C72_1626130 [compost metagenome]